MLITISRQYGAGGSHVAQRVADLLGWRVVDNELVERVAAEAGLAPEDVARREERVPGFVQRLAQALVAGTPEAGPGPAIAVPMTGLAEPDLVRITERVVAQIAAEGRVVLVGRAAAAVLASEREAIHVRVVASREMVSIAGGAAASPSVVKDAQEFRSTIEVVAADAQMIELVTEESLRAQVRAAIGISPLRLFIDDRLRHTWGGIHVDEPPIDRDREKQQPQRSRDHFERPRERDREPRDLPLLTTGHERRQREQARQRRCHEQHPSEAPLSRRRQPALGGSGRIRIPDRCTGRRRLVVSVRQQNPCNGRAGGKRYDGRAEFRARTPG